MGARVATTLAPPSPAELLAVLQAAFAALPRAPKIQMQSHSAPPVGMPFTPAVPSASSSVSCVMPPIAPQQLAAATVPLLLAPQISAPWGLPGGLPQAPNQLLQMPPPLRLDTGNAAAVAAQSWIAASQGATIEKAVEPAVQETQRRLAAYSNLLLGATSAESNAGTEQTGDEAPWRSRKRRRAATAA